MRLTYANMCLLDTFSICLTKIWHKACFMGAHIRDEIVFIHSHRTPDYTYINTQFNQTRIYAYAPIYIYIYIYIYMCVCVYVCVSVCENVYVCPNL